MEEIYKNAQYFNNPDNTLGGIRVSINGVISAVPINEANIDYANIMKLVEEGKLTIAEPEANAQETTK